MAVYNNRMIGVGIDIGATQTKGVAIQVFEDGSVSILEALMIPTAELGARADELGMKLGSHRPAVMTRPTAVVSISHPDLFMDRVKLPLAPEAGNISREDLLAGIWDEKITPPVPTQVKEDLWDLHVLRLLRRSTDLEQLGRKQAEGLFVKIPKSVGANARTAYKHLIPAGLVPTPLAVLNGWLRFAPAGKSAPVLVINAGIGQFEAMLVADGELQRAVTVQVADLAGTVARLAKIEPAQAPARIMNADVTSSEPLNAAVKDAIVKTLQRLQTALLTETSGLPRPQRVQLTGGLSQLRGVPRLANATLELAAEAMPQPERLRSVQPLPAPFPVFLGAIGAALQAAGASPLRLLPVRHAKRPAAKPVAAMHLPHLHMPEIDMPHLPAPKRMAGAAIRVAGILGHLPSRMGWSWIALGAAAALAVIPTAWWIGRLGGTKSLTEREIELLAPENMELERQARLIKQYVQLTGTGALNLLPWGEVMMEVANRMPPGTFIARLDANAERLLISGRVKGNAGTRMKQIADRLRSAPVFKQQGLSPPEF